MSNDKPDFICPSCLTQVDETDAFYCCPCGRILCKKCGNVMVDFEDYQKGQAANARDDELEDERLFGE
jgi:hypothetical protein